MYLKYILKTGKMDLFRMQLHTSKPESVQAR